MEIPLKFALASLIYLVIGSTMGVFMLLTSESIKPSHAHVLLIGFVAMMIFGVGYHLLPVFAGTDLYSLRLAEIHFWLQNIGYVIFFSNLNELSGRGIALSFFSPFSPVSLASLLQQGYDRL